MNTKQEELIHARKMITSIREMCIKVDQLLKEIDLDREERKQLKKQLDTMIKQKYKYETVERNLINDVPIFIDINSVV